MNTLEETDLDQNLREIIENIEITISPLDGEAYISDETIINVIEHIKGFIGGEND